MNNYTCTFIMFHTFSVFSHCAGASLCQSCIYIFLHLLQLNHELQFCWVKLWTSHVWSLKHLKTHPGHFNSEIAWKRETKLSSMFSLRSFEKMVWDYCLFTGICEISVCCTHGSESVMKSLQTHRAHIWSNCFVKSITDQITWLNLERGMNWVWHCYAAWSTKVQWNLCWKTSPWYNTHVRGGSWCMSRKSPDEVIV